MVGPDGNIPSLDGPVVWALCLVWAELPVLLDLADHNPLDVPEVLEVLGALWGLQVLDRHHDHVIHLFQEVQMHRNHLWVLDIHRIQVDHDSLLIKLQLEEGQLLACYQLQCQHWASQNGSRKNPHLIWMQL